MNASLTKINAGGKIFYLLTEYLIDQPALKLTLTNGHDVWRGQLSEDQLAAQAETIEKELESFFELTLKALIKCGIINEKFAYQVQSSEDSIKFSWKQVLEDGIKFQLGSATLTKALNETNDISSIFEVAISQFKNMKGEIASLSNANEKLLDERKRMLKRLEDSVQTKDNLEKDLYLKFTTVLNNKKEKIRDLKKQVEAGAVQISGSKLQNNIDNDEKESEEEENTDDEETNRTKKRQSSDDKESRIQGGSVILEKNEDEEDLAPAVKRRARVHRQRGTKLPTLPRNVSFPRPVKQDSGSKSQGSQSKAMPKDTGDPWSVDVDDLMDQL